VEGVLKHRMVGWGIVWFCDLIWQPKLGTKGPTKATLLKLSKL